MPAAVDAWIDRHHVLCLAVFSVLFLLIVSARARVAVLWHDELYTLLASRLDAARLWQAHQDGLDYGPPLNTLATRLVHLFADPGPIASRLPPMLGVLSAAIAVFFIVRRRATRPRRCRRRCSSASPARSATRTRRADTA
jgi:hypothetical protein